MNVKTRIILITILVSLFVWVACITFVLTFFHQTVNITNLTPNQIALIVSTLIIVLLAALSVGLIVSRMTVQRQKVLEALKESEERVRTLSDATFEGIFILDVDILLEANDSGAKMLDLKPSEIPGKLFIDYISIESRELVKNNIQKSYAEPYEAVLQRRENAIFLAELQNRDATYKSKKVKVVSVRDITERKKAEEALRTSELNFRNSMDNSPLGICIWSTQGKAIYVNQKLLDIYGYENPEEYQSKSPQERFTTESYQEYLLRAEEAKHGKEPEHYQVSIICKDGDIRYLDVFSKKVFWNGEYQLQLLYTDITIHKKAEEALRTSELNFRASLDNSPLGIRISEINNNTLYANQALMDIFGYKNIDEVKVTPPQEHYSKECYADYLNMREKYGRSEVMPDQVDIDIIRKDGTVRHLQALFKVIIWDGKKQFQTIYNDITERKRAEDALKASEARFRQLTEELKRQNDQKTEFLHHIAHELKTPLTAVIASSEILTSKDSNTISLEQKNLLLNNINRSVWIMDETVNGLLDQAKIQIGQLSLNLEPINLKEKIMALTSQILPLFKNRQQSIEIEIPNVLPLVKGDQKHVTQVILNLLSNANKFSSTGGEIIIRVREQNNMVLVEVKDSAPPINETDRQNLFEPYHRGGSLEVQRRVPGLGLGLAISKNLVTLMGGEIGVITDGENGNTFFFTLPIWRD